MPAYGMTYDTEEEVKDAWKRGVTFKAIGGPYLDTKDWNKYGSPLDTLTYAFKNLTVYLHMGLLP